MKPPTYEQANFLIAAMGRLKELADLQVHATNGQSRYGIKYPGIIAGIINSRMASEVTAINEALERMK